MKIAYFLPFLLIGCSPQTYEDCILDNIKGVNSDRAAMVIRHACEIKFGKPEE